MKRNFYLFTVMAALFLLSAPSLRAQDSGTCGDSITWTLDSDSVLTISGTGAMYDYTSSDAAPWKNLPFAKAVIGNGITTIGKRAFTLCLGLTGIDIPESVKSIAERAFVYCTGLKSVDIPTSVTSIGSAAFAYCSELTSVTVPDSVTSIKDNSFFRCPRLTSVTFPDSLKSIGESAFYKCSGLTSVTIPASVETIDDEAFSECTGLTKIESLAENPPVCGENVFDYVDTKKCVLSVPEASVDAYKAADGWKDFYSIVSGIGGVTEESNAGVSASNGVITVTGVAANTVVEVYSISGTLVYRGTSNTVAVPSAGIYVVKAAGKAVKVNAAR